MTEPHQPHDPPAGPQPPAQPPGGYGPPQPNFGPPQHHYAPGQCPQPPYPPYSGPPAASPPGRNNALPLILAAVALLVVAVGAGGYVLLSRSDGAGSAGGSPRKAAEAFVNAKADKKGLLCAADRKLIEGANGSSSYATGNPADMPDVNAKATLDSVDVADGSDKGTFTVKLDVKIGSRNHSQSATYDLVRENGDWKVCGILSAAPSF